VTAPFVFTEIEIAAVLRVTPEAVRAWLRLGATDLNRIRARIKRMPPRERKSFAADVRYVSATLVNQPAYCETGRPISGEHLV
jgi:hypothetical protein